MWTRSHLVSTKMNIKSCLVTLEHIILDWFVKWIVYKILDKALENVKFEGRLDLEVASEKIALLIVRRCLYWISDLNKPDRKISCFLFYLPVLLPFPLFFFVSSYRRLFLTTWIDLKNIRARILRYPKTPVALRFRGKSAHNVWYMYEYMYTLLNNMILCE